MYVARFQRSKSCRNCGIPLPRSKSCVSKVMKSVLLSYLSACCLLPHRLTDVSYSEPHTTLCVWVTGVAMQAGMESARMKQQLELEAAAKIRADEVRRRGGRIKFIIVWNLLSLLQWHIFWKQNEEWIRSNMKETTVP